jgi:penicillin-binding protein 1A
MTKPIYWIKPSTRRQKILRIVNVLVVLMIGGGIAAALTAVIAYWVLSADLPKLDSLDDYHPNVISYVYDDAGNVVGEFKYENQRRILIEFEQVPKTVINAFVAAEDAAFWRHEGLDYMGMVRAMIRNFATGKFSQGGSTITQQVTRSLLLSREKTMTRKIKEMILAQRIEQKLGKEDILTLYLNEIYFGNGAYGVQAAAENYFGKTVGELSLSEASVIAGLPQAPSRYSPYWNEKAARVRQQYVLRQMVREQYVTQAEATAALSEPWNLKPIEDLNVKHAPFYVEHVRRYVMAKYGAEKVLKEGLKIHTPLNMEQQQAADAAIADGLRVLAKRQGWQGPKRRISADKAQAYLDALAKRQPDKPKPGTVVEAMVLEVGSAGARISTGGRIGHLPLAGARWIDKIVEKKRTVPMRVRDLSKILSPNDVIDVKRTDDANNLAFSLEPKPISQAALVAMDPNTRYVTAMVGGYDFAKSEFNRAIQARRQPGSSFKPIVYAAALDAGMTPATKIMDTALVFKDGWKPANYDRKFKGEMTLREALTKSVNTITIRIVDRISADYVYRYAKRLGIASLAGADLSMGLGTYEIPPIEIINAYAVFAAGGRFAEPIFVKRIEGRDGQVLEQHIPSGDVAPAPMMENIPDVSHWGDSKDLEQGVEVDTTVSDPVARRQFYADFGLDKRENKSEPEKSGVPSTEVNEEDKIVFTQVIDPQTAFLITSIMHSVATRGTGARSNALGKIVAGKTGTTNNYVDAWFIGYSPDVLAGVWVGNDSGSKSLGRGESGSSAALPIWVDFMKAALGDRPNKEFKIPEGISMAKIDPETGLLAHPETPEAFSEYFKSGTEPVQYAPAPDAVDPTDFYKMELEE